MKYLIFSCLALFTIVSSAEEIVFRDIAYKLKTENTLLTCGDFQVKSKTRSFPFSLKESEIPYEVTMGHYGKPHIISQSFIVGNVTYDNVDSLLPNYERIDKNRKYLAKLASCAEPYTFTISLWGGGNCKNICEAWALVKIARGGKITSVKGLTHQEFKSHN